MTYWSHIVTTLASNNPTDSYREFTMFHVPIGATLLRSIVDVAISGQIIFTPATGQPPVYPVAWALGDVNSDVSPHLSDSQLAAEAEGVPLLAHGLVSPVFSPFVTINDYNADVTNPPFPVHGSISGAPDQEITMYVSGSQHVDSQAQRLFPSAHPRLALSILTATSSFPYSDESPTTVFSVRQLWSRGNL